MKSRFTIVGRTHMKRFYNSEISEKSIIYILKKSKICIVNVSFFNATLNRQTKKEKDTGKLKGRFLNVTD